MVPDLISTIEDEKGDFENGRLTDLGDIYKIQQKIIEREEDARLGNCWGILWECFLHGFGLNRLIWWESPNYIFLGVRVGGMGGSH